jgi:hypothetical protein
LDIEMMDNYYSGGEPALARLCQYANHGVSLLTNETKRKEVLGVTANTVIESLIRSNPFANIALTTVKTLTHEATEPVINEKEEVEADIRVLEHYLIHGIFDASGFSAFCQQELDNLRDSFLDVNHEGYWTGVVRNEWQAGNAELLKELPVKLQSFSFDTETSDRLKQLRIALDTVASLPFS